MDRLAAKQIVLLHAFQLPRTATTDGANFRPLHWIWREVYTCLEKIDAAVHLDSALAIEMLVGNFLAICRQSYIKLKHDPSMATKKLGEV